MNANTRPILAHKQSTSGRLRFSVCPCGPMAFEALAGRRDPGRRSPDGRSPAPHGSAARRRKPARPRWQPLRGNGIQAEVGTGSGAIRHPAGPLHRHRPPFEAALRIGGRFIELTEARDRPRVELNWPAAPTKPCSADAVVAFATNPTPRKWGHSVVGAFPPQMQAGTAFASCLPQPRQRTFAYGETTMINLTPNATKAIRRFIKGETPVAGLRIFVSGGGCSGMQYGLRLNRKKARTTSNWKSTNSSCWWIP